MKVRQVLARLDARFAAWLIFAAVMLGGRCYNYYLAGWHVYMLMVGAALLVFAAAASALAALRKDTCTCCEHDAASRRPWMETFVHFIPLVIFLRVGPTTLGQHAASVTNPFSVPAVMQAVEESGSAAEVSPDGYAVKTLLDLYTSPDYRTRKMPVEVIGRAYAPTPDDIRRLPAGVKPEDVPMLLYRHYINCCVADARQITVILKNLDVKAFPNAAWLRIKGSTIPPTPLMPLVSIAVDAAEAIAEPAQPYIY